MRAAKALLERKAKDKMTIYFLSKGTQVVRVGERMLRVPILGIVLLVFGTKAPKTNQQRSRFKIEDEISVRSTGIKPSVHKRNSPHHVCRIRSTFLQ